MTTLLLIALLAAPSNATVGNDLTAGGATSSASISAASAITGKTYSIAAPSSDAAPDPVTVKAANSYYGATTAAYKNGAPLLLSGGLGQTTITIANSSTIGGDTLTWVRTVSGVTPANVVWTEGVATYSCAALGADSDANRDACACLLYTYCNANLPSGVYACRRLDETCSDSKVYVQWVPYTTVGASVTPSDASVTVAQGTIGDVMVRAKIAGIPGTAGNPCIRIGDATTGICANQYGLDFTSSGGNTTVYATNFYTRANDSSGGSLPGIFYGNGTTTANVSTSAAGYFGWSGRSHLTAPADAEITATNNAGTTVIWHWLAPQDAPATCAPGDMVVDTGGATIEQCFCSAPNAWKCAALAAGPAD